MGKCAGITQAGTACKGIPIEGSQFCYVHSPDHAEERKRHGSKGGKRGGRGRPMAEVNEAKRVIKGILGRLLREEIDRAYGTASIQAVNAWMKIVDEELKARELEIAERRLELDEEERTKLKDRIELLEETANIPWSPSRGA